MFLQEKGDSEAQQELNGHTAENPYNRIFPGSQVRYIVKQIPVIIQSDKFLAENIIGFYILERHDDSIHRRVIQHDQYHEEPRQKKQDDKQSVSHLF